MTFEKILFYLFAAILVFSALRVISARNPIHAVLFLVVCFVASSGLWMLLEAEFLAIALVLVYVGAVMVLFLFVVMMLDINIAVLREGFAQYLPIGAAVALTIAGMMIYVVGSDFFALQQMSEPRSADYSNTRELGLLLYTTYVYPFEIAAMILLVAIVAAITLTMRRRPETKYQDPGQQIKVQSKDRLRIISMPAEKK